MAEVRLVGPDGQEIPVSLVYGQVELAAKYSQQDYKLDSLLDGIEEEYNQSDWLCTSIDIFVSSRIVKHLSWPTFSLQPLDLKVQSVSEYRHNRIGWGMRGKLMVGVIIAWTDKLYPASYVILHWDL